jgi:hypothetical protein
VLACLIGKQGASMHPDRIDVDAGQLTAEKLEADWRVGAWTPSKLDVFLERDGRLSGRAFTVQSVSGNLFDCSAPKPLPRRSELNG